MLRRRTELGSTTIALAMAVFLVLMTVVTVYIFMAKIWWFPPAITDFGHEIDAQFARTLRYYRHRVCGGAIWTGLSPSIASAIMVRR